MRKTLLALFAIAAIGVQAQTGRTATVQGARTLMVTDAKGKADRYSVTSEKSLLIKLKDGKLEFPDKTVEKADVQSMRLEIPQKFMLSEDSTTFTPYNVDFGLLALRRTLLVNKWNTLVVPVSISGRHVLDAFGEGAQLATFKDIIEAETEAQVNFSTIDLNTDEVVVEPGVHYLIRPTREPDIAAGATSTINYGTSRVAGPAYLLEGATMTTSNKAPQVKTLKSDQENVRLRLRGSYIQPPGYLRPVNAYVFNDDGNLALHADTVNAKGFSSWMQQSKNANETALRFYVDGVSLMGDLTQIADVVAGKDAGMRETVYDLQGRRVATPRRGLYIINGKKVYVR